MSPLGRAMAGLGAVVAVWAGLGAGARATYGARTTADEPQYLMTAISLAEDRSLDVADERAAGRYREFHEVGLPVQEAVQPDGRRVSPHDPLLPALLAIPVALGGWLAAKLFLAGLAGGLAALMLWTAVRRFAVPMPVAVVAVGCFALAAPLAVYGTQVYPELPAALAVTGAIALLTGTMSRPAIVGFAALVVALPWLSVKYVPVALALTIVAVLGLARRRRVEAIGGLGALLAGGAALYAVGHLAWYGGLTPYAAGGHFSGGELTVMGASPDYAGRAARLLNLLVDRGFGLAVWQPAWLLLVPAAAALVRARPSGWVALALPLAAGWASATFLALTMHGWWWPGRQVVVALPAAVLMVAWWAARVSWVRVALAVLAAWGAVVYAWLLVEVYAGRLALVVDFERTANPLVRWLRPVLPDGRAGAPGGAWVIWVLLTAGLAWWGWQSMGQRKEPTCVVSEPVWQ